MKKNITQYNLVPVNYQLSGWYDIERLCNGFTVTNIGNDPVLVNDQIFYPGIPGTSLGDSRSFGGNEGEVYVGRLKVAFAGNFNNPEIEVVQKIFVGTQIIDI